MNSTCHKRMDQPRKLIAMSMLLWWRQLLEIESLKNAVLEFAIKNTCSWQTEIRMESNMLSLPDKVVVELPFARPNRPSVLEFGIRTPIWAMARNKTQEIAKFRFKMLLLLFTPLDTEIQQYIQAIRFA